MSATAKDIEQLAEDCKEAKDRLQSIHDRLEKFYPKHEALKDTESVSAHKILGMLEAIIKVL